MPRTVLILGMHRSGTSCLTGSLQEAGLQLGEVNQKTRCNEKGTRENVAIMELNDAVLESAGASWDNPPREDIVWRKDHKVWRKQVIKAAVQEPAWGFKDPRTLLTLDGWLEALPNAQFIGTFRDPIAVAKSLHVRNGFPLDRGLALWRAYNERLLALCDARDVAVINFDWAPMRYQRGLEVLSEKIGLAPPQGGFKFFETRLRRNESAAHLELPPALRQIHRRLQTAARMTMHRARARRTSAVVSHGGEKSAEGDRPHPASNDANNRITTKAESDRASHIAALQKALHSEEAQPANLDQLGDLLATDDRWTEADEAYRRALFLRCEALGFRGGNAPAAPGDARAARARLNDFCRVAARLGAQHWADNLTAIVTSAGASTRSSGEAAPWPKGSALPDRECIAIGPRPNTRIKKKLSIMIPVYGVEREDWLREALESVISQNIDPEISEIVIIDDGSEDDAAKTIASSYGDRVRYTRNEKNLGLVGNHNRCINEAMGDFVHILHQDDRVQPGFYDALLPVLSRNSDIVAGVTNTAYINSAGEITSEPPPLQELGRLRNWRVALSLQHRIQFPSIIVRRRVYEDVGGFSPTLTFSFDWDLWNHIAASGPIWFEPRHLAHFRVHEGSATHRFGWLERVQDAMQTVSHMARLTPTEKRRAIAEMAMHKFILRYWTLLGAGSGAVTDDQQSLIDFLLSGWTTNDEAAQLRSLFSALKRVQAQ